MGIPAGHKGTWLPHKEVQVLWYRSNHTRMYRSCGTGVITQGGTGPVVQE